jgi:hypothetical protein
MKLFSKPGIFILFNTSHSSMPQSNSLSTLLLSTIPVYSFMNAKLHLNAISSKDIYTPAPIVSNAPLPLYQ